MRTMIAILMMTTGAAAQTGSEAYQAAAMRLTTTFQCAEVTGDEDAYERAKADALEAGFEGEPLDAAGLIAAVEEQEADTSALTPEFCADMVQMLE
jgi:hypothetical protein